MSNLFAMPLLLAGVAFVAGWLTAKFSVYVGARANQLETPKHESVIRALEASLRVARKETEETSQQLLAATEELEALRASLDEMAQTSHFQEEELEQARLTVKQESAKVVNLRRELSERAEQTIRAQVQARDSDNELSLLKAGIEFEQDDEPAETGQPDTPMSRRRGDSISDC